MSYHMRLSPDRMTCKLLCANLQNTKFTSENIRYYKKGPYAEISITWVVRLSAQRSNASRLLLITVLVGSILQVADGFANHTAGTLRRTKRRQPQQQQQPGFFFPIAMYTVRHHRPAAERGRNVRPETWEYRGQYFYGYKPRANSNRRQAARLLAAGLPLLLAPLLSIIFSFPVLVPVAQTTTITNGAATLPFRPSPWVGKRKRRRRRRRVGDPRQQQREKSGKMKELEVVANYLQQVDYDERQQSRVMVNYLQCNGLLGTEDHCLERLSCEFADPANMNAPELEKTVTSILLGHMLNNEFIPRPFKKRLKSAAVHGKNNSGKCNKFFCHYVDNNWDYTATYPQGGVKVPTPTPKRTPPKVRLPPQRPG